MRKKVAQWIFEQPQILHTKTKSYDISHQCHQKIHFTAITNKEAQEGFVLAVVSNPLEKRIEFFSEST